MQPAAGSAPGVAFLSRVQDLAAALPGWALIPVGTKGAPRALQSEHSLGPVAAAPPAGQEAEAGPIVWFPCLWSPLSGKGAAGPPSAATPSLFSACSELQAGPILLFQCLQA